MLTTNPRHMNYCFDWWDLWFEIFS